MRCVLYGFKIKILVNVPPLLPATPFSYGTDIYAIKPDEQKYSLMYTHGCNNVLGNIRHLGTSTY